MASRPSREVIDAIPADRMAEIRAEAGEMIAEGVREAGFLQFSAACPRHPEVVRLEHCRDCRRSHDEGVDHGR